MNLNTPEVLYVSAFTVYQLKKECKLKNEEARTLLWEAKKTGQERVNDLLKQVEQYEQCLSKITDMLTDDFEQ